MKRPQVVMVAGIAIILGLVWFTYTIHREPCYEGKSLSGWLDLYWQLDLQTDHGAAWEKAGDAVRHIGTNAVPFLLTWVEMDRPMTARNARLWQKVGSWKPGTPGQKLLLEFITRRQSQGQHGFLGFVILGETARGAAPDLVRIATHGNDQNTYGAMDALCYLGRDGFDSLFSVITNTVIPQKRRIDGLSTLGMFPHLATNAGPAIALLIYCLRDPEPEVVNRAAIILGTIHQESDICVPALVECARSTNELTRLSCVRSLMDFGPRARAAFPELTRLLSDPAASVRSAARIALRLVAPEVLQPTSAP